MNTTDNDTRIDTARVIPPQEVLSLIAPRTARSIGALPVMLKDGILTVCVRDRYDFSIQDRLERMLPDYRIRLVEALNVDTFNMALRSNYPDAAVNGTLDQPEQLFAYILRRALARNASDIHVDPMEDVTRIRLRVDGKLQTDRTEPNDTAAEFVSYIKVLANLDIAEKRVPQDGAIDFPLDGVDISLRVATVPTLYGEHVTLRVLSQSRAFLPLDKLEELGMHERQFKMFNEAIHAPNGVIVISGPTGSGKTTTLYAVLRELQKSDTLHLISIEDPVEKPVPGVTQIPVDARKDRVSFARALRSVLRHDPDVVMIGEVRDGETASTALRSALTGHLVLTTLHTNNAPGILTRLTDLGVPAYLVTATLRIAIAQRLMRRPCKACKTMEPATHDECLRYGWDTEQPPNVPRIHGCPYCGMTGYSGRTAIYEVFPVTDEVRRMLLEGAKEGDLCAWLKQHAPDLTLRGDALHKVLDGETTLDELERTVVEEFDLDDMPADPLPADGEEA